MLEHAGQLRAKSTRSRKENSSAPRAHFATAMRAGRVISSSTTSWVNRCVASASTTGFCNADPFENGQAEGTQHQDQSSSRSVCGDGDDNDCSRDQEYHQYRDPLNLGQKLPHVSEYVTIDQRAVVSQQRHPIRLVMSDVGSPGYCNSSPSIVLKASLKEILTPARSRCVCRTRGSFMVFQIL
jgi:hypothetical protein